MGKIINPFGGNDSTSNPPIQKESTPLPKKDLETEVVQEKSKSNELPEGYVDVMVDGQSRRRLKTYHKERAKPLSIMEQWAIKKAAKKNGR